MRPSTSLCCLAALVAFALPSAQAADPNPIWSNPESARSENPDFALQGEYGSAAPGAPTGVQVVALGGGKFEAHLLDGGLPGLGWTRDKKHTLLSGTGNAGTASFTSADGKIAATLANGKFSLTGAPALPRIERASPTLGAPAPAGAVVLFDGTTAENWDNGKVENGLLAASNATSKPRFRNYSAHFEFRTPYKPFARGQDRGNSGIYHGGRWETQVLDSFGLKGEQNECGGIYSIAEPRLNMCLPPLTWQTYDVDFTNATFDAQGKQTAWPKISVNLNGVLIHDKLELNKENTTAAPLGGPLKDEDRPLFIQNHGNPVLFRNIWVLPRK